MRRKSIKKIINRRLKWYKAEVILLWIIIGIGVILIPTGVGVYLYLGQLTIGQEWFTLPARNFIVAQVQMVYIFARVLGVVFTLVGIITIILSLDRLTSTRETYRMASLIKDKGILEE